MNIKFNTKNNVNIDLIENLKLDVLEEQNEKIRKIFEDDIHEEDKISNNLATMLVENYPNSFDEIDKVKIKESLAIESEDWADVIKSKL